MSTTTHFEIFLTPPAGKSARRAVILSARQRHDILAALAAAHAAAGQHRDAVITAQEALQRATESGDTVSADLIGGMLEGFRREGATEHNTD